MERDSSDKQINIFDFLDALERAKICYTLESQVVPYMVDEEVENLRAIAVVISLPDDPLPSTEKTRVLVCFHRYSHIIYVFYTTQSPDKPKLMPIYEMLGMDVPDITVDTEDDLNEDDPFHDE